VATFAHSLGEYLVISTVAILAWPMQTAQGMNKSLIVIVAAALVVTLTNLAAAEPVAASQPTSPQGVAPDRAQGPSTAISSDEPGISPLVVPTAPPSPPSPPSAPPPVPVHDAESPSPQYQRQQVYERQQAAVLPTPQLDTGDVQLKSPGMALGLSLGITLGSIAASIAMVAAGIDTRDGGALVGAGFTIGTLGLTFGPSVGHFYAGNVGRGIGMGFARLGVFAGGFGLGVLSLASAFGGSEGAAVAFLVCSIGAGLTGVGLAIWDIATAPGAARRANKRILQRTAGLTLGPLVTDAAAGKRGYGLALGGRF